MGLLNTLPAEGDGWTQEQRDSFVTTFGHVLDYCIPIKDEEQEIEE